jgi:predicted Ser/Thr protein kinase/thioredoxin-like negative regulator of GroEL
MKEKSTYGLKPEQLERLLSIGSEEKKTDALQSQGSTQPQIEGYEILGKLGEAGQGQIWRALQLSTNRQVALKVPIAGLISSDKALARFEREVELAASLKHPNITQIHDSGIQHGIYYYAMDLIEGMQLDEYVKQHNLTIRQVLELMRTICLAVQHAHQNGVIHRDLKPSNIIVTEDGRPYIVDFGLAKNLLKDDLFVSIDGEAAGTPAYMSPEQAAGHIDKLDTRTDVYSIGVILFTLLTGESPHDLSGSRIEVMRRIAQEQVRRPRKISPQIDKDLEFLLLKALDNEPDRRYMTAGEMARDIENYLQGAPLIAGPPGTLYRLKKFVRRHKALVGGVAAVLIVSVIGTVVSVIFALDKAKALEQQARALARNKAIAIFLNDDILVPFAGENFKPANIREVFDAAAEKLGTRFKDYPLLEADMRFKFGSIYTFQFGDYDAALSSLNRAIEIKQREPGGNPYATINWLGLLYVEMGKYREAEGTFRELVKSLEERHEQGKGGLGPLYYAAKSHLGGVCLLLGRYDEAEPYICEAPLHPWWEKGHWREALYVGRIAGLRRAQGRYEEAKQIYNNLLQASQSFEKTEYWNLMKGLGITYTLEGNLKEAEPLLENALEGARNELGEKHMNTVNFKIALAVLRTKQGRHTDAELLFDQALRNMQNRLDEDHPRSLEAKSHFGVLCREQGQYDEAEEILSNVIQNQSKKLGEDHPDTLESMHELAVLYKEQTRYDEAEPLLLAAVNGRIKKLGLQHPHTLESIDNLIELYEAWNKPKQAVQWRAKLAAIENGK